VVGSNIANILLILGVAAVIMPVAVSPKAFWRDAVALALASLAGAVLVFNGELTRIAGVILLVGLATYIVTAFRSERSGPVETATPDPVATTGILRPALLAVVGIAITIVGARLLVSGAIDLARGLGVSDALIGLTIVAVGTSLPELVTAVIAALRRQGDIAFGNVIGSNIYNILGILGATALVHPIPVPAEIAAFDIWVMLAATLTLIVLAFTGWRISRREGVAMLAAYAAYTGWLVASA